jgi:hypothetical protein
MALCKKMPVTQARETVWISEHVHTASNGSIDFAFPKGLAGDLQ